MNIKTIAQLSGALICIALAYSWTGGSESTTSVDPVTTTGRTVRALHAGGYSVFGDTRWTRGVWTNPFEFTVTVESSEDDPAGSGFLDSEQVYSTSYEPDIVAGRSSEDFVISGIGKGEDLVVERWLLEPAKGSYYTYFEEIPPVPPIGTSTTVREPIVSVFAGLPWIEPALRAAPGVPRRTEVYRDDVIGSIDSMTFDGEGRYVLAHSIEDKKIYRLDARSTSVPPVAIADETDIALLADGDAHIEDRVTNSGKRALVVWDDHDMSHVAIMWDNDNDGIFDQIDEMTVADFEFAYPNGLAPF